MSAHRTMLTVFAAAVAVVVLQQPAQAQLLDRIKKAAQKTTDAAKQAGTAEARAQYKSAVDDIAKELVEDGSFTAVLSPWSSSDGAKRTEMARFSGTATAVSTGSGYQIRLCDASSAKSWTASFGVQNKPTGGATPGGVSKPAAQATPVSPSATLAGAEYKLPTDLVTVDVVGAGVKTNGAAEGSFKVGSVSQTTYAGVAKMKFAKVMLPGQTTAEAVEIGAAFRARIQQPGEARAGCGGSP